MRYVIDISILKDMLKDYMKEYKNSLETQSVIRRIWKEVTEYEEGE